MSLTLLGFTLPSTVLIRFLLFFSLLFVAASVFCLLLFLKITFDSISQTLAVTLTDSNAAQVLRQHPETEVVFCVSRWNVLGCGGGAVRWTGRGYFRVQGFMREI